MRDEETIFRQPKNTMPRIEHLWLYVSVDAEDGNEGVVLAQIGDVLMPLIAADHDRLTQMTPLAHEAARLGEMKMKLIKFSAREEVGEIIP